MSDKDPYSFLPNNNQPFIPSGNTMDPETAERLKRFAASSPKPATKVPQTPEEMEAFARNANPAPKSFSFGPDGMVQGFDGLRLTDPNEEEAIPEPEEPIGSAPSYSELSGRIQHHSSLDFLKPSSQVNANPLQQFYRAPELFVHLPSQGIFNEPGDFEFTVNGQVGVYPMTAQDEIALRTPDALLNGAALEKLVRSCVPAVKNVRTLPSPDFDVLLLAIRSVSAGPQLDYDTSCPKCKTRNSYGIDIPSVLETVKPMAGPETAVFKSGLKVVLRPYTFDSNIKAALVTFEEAQLIRAVTQQNATEQERMLQFNESFGRISQLNRDLFTDAIVSIETPTGQTVTNKQHIREFLDNISKGDFDLIEAKIKLLNNSGYQRTAKVTCNNPECKHEYDIDVNYDPTRFFGKGF